MIDSHAHLTFKISQNRQKTLSIAQQLKNAQKAGITDIVTIILQNYEKELTQVINSLNQNIKVHVSIGIHPEDIVQKSSDQIDNIVQQLSSFCDNNIKNINAIGECGLDYYNNRPKENQKEAFVAQIQLANKLKLPLIIHTRPSTINSTDAYEDMIHILKKYQPQYGFVMHCFSSSYDIAKKFLDLGSYIGFAGNITYPSAQNIRETAQKIPLEKILPETDSPFLAPQKYRGQINQPAYIVEIGKVIAQLKNIHYEDFSNICTNNLTKFLS